LPCSAYTTTASTAVMLLADDSHDLSLFPLLRDVAEAVDVTLDWSLDSLRGQTTQ
jgi:hypothetical protein